MPIAELLRKMLTETSLSEEEKFSKSDVDVSLKQNMPHQRRSTVKFKTVVWRPHPPRQAYRYRTISYQATVSGGCTVCLHDIPIPGEKVSLDLPLIDYSQTAMPSNQLKSESQCSGPMETRLD